MLKRTTDDKKTDQKKPADTVETPEPPQHMDPSKKPKTERRDSEVKKHHHRDKK